MPSVLVIPGVPDWLSFLLLLAGLAFGLAFLLMPFAVFGVKSRLEAIEQRLAESEEAMRLLARQVASQPALARAGDLDDLPVATLGRVRPRAPEPARSGAPPVPPPPVVPQVPASAQGRAEPRIDWPRRNG
jgi:predicted lipid-binding transport protein (Tim44 family)